MDEEPQVTTDWVQGIDDDTVVRIRISNHKYATSYNEKRGYRFSRFLTGDNDDADDKPWTVARVVEWVSRYLPEAHRARLSAELTQQLETKRALYRLIGDAVLQIKESNDENA